MRKRMRAWSRGVARPLALALLCLACSIGITMQTTTPAMAFAGPDPVEIGTTLAGGAGVEAGEGVVTVVGESACAASVVCGLGAVTLGAALYGTKDLWLPAVKGLFNSVFHIDGNGMGSACTGGVSPQGRDQAGNGLTITWSYSNCGGDITNPASCPSCYPAAIQNSGSSTTITTVCKTATGMVTSTGAWSFGGGSISLGVDPHKSDSGTADWTGLCGSGATLEYVKAINVKAARSSGVSPAFDFSWGDAAPDAQASVKTTVTCQQPDGTTTTITGTMSGGTQIPVPSCAYEVGPTAIPLGASISAGWAGAEQPQENITMGNPRTDYPDCFDASGAWKASCVVRVYIGGQPCHVGDAECVNWQTAHQDDGVDVECQMGTYVVPLKACEQLKNAYKPNTGTRTLTAANPQTGDDYDPNLDPGPASDPGPNADPTPLPTTGPNPNDDPEPNYDPGPSTGRTGSNCWGSGWSWNPISWVYVPVKCALAWAFVPDGSTFTDVETQIRDGWDGTPIEELINAVSGWGFGSGSTDCKGPHVSLDVMSNHIEMDPLDACSGWQATAAGFVNALLSAGICVFGGLACVRAVGSGFGWAPGGGGGAA